jgi:hypothetical protein
MPPSREEHYDTAKRGHFYFGERGHYHFGMTEGRVDEDKKENSSLVMEAAHHLGSLLYGYKWICSPLF